MCGLCFIPYVCTLSRIVPGAWAFKNKVSTAYLYTNVFKANVTVNMFSTRIKSTHPLFLFSILSLHFFPWLCSPKTQNCSACSLHAFAHADFWACRRPSPPLWPQDTCTTPSPRVLLVTSSEIPCLSLPFPSPFPFPTSGLFHANFFPCAYTLCFSNDLLQEAEDFLKFRKQVQDLTYDLLLHP